MKTYCEENSRIKNEQVMEKEKKKDNSYANLMKAVKVTRFITNQKINTY